MMRVTKHQIYFYCYMAFCFLLGTLIAGLPGLWRTIAFIVLVGGGLLFSAWAYYKAGH